MWYDWSEHEKRREERDSAHERVGGLAGRPRNLVRHLAGFREQRADVKGENPSGKALLRTYCRRASEAAVWIAGCLDKVGAIGDGGPQQQSADKREECLGQGSSSGDREK